MPRRRVTKNETSKRPAPALPEGDEGKDMDHEKRREKVQTLIRDFKTEGLQNCRNYCIVFYSSIYIAPLNSHRQTEALLVRLAPRKETSFKK